MKIILTALIFLSTLMSSAQATDPQTICETKLPTLTVSSFKHCQEGDLIKVDSFDLLRVCDFNSIIVPVQNEYLCVYRGSKRTIRERPLSKSEEQFQSENVEKLVEKYAH